MVSGRPITLEFAADVAAFLKDVKKIDVSLEDVEQAFTAVGDDADKAAREIDGSMDKAGRSLRDFAAEADRAARDTSGSFRRMGDDSHRAASSMGDAGREAGNEFRQNLGESIASGDLSNIVGDTIGGLISSVSGGLAGAFVAVGAAGVLAFNSIRERAERVEAATQRLVDVILGASGSLDELSRKAVFEEWFEGLKENTAAAADFAEAIETGVITAEELRDAVTGVPGAMEEVRGKMAEVTNETKAAGKATGVVTLKWRDGVDALDETNDALGGTIGRVQDLNTIAGQTSNYWKSLADNAALARDRTREIHTLLTDIANTDLNKTIRIDIDPRDLAAAKFLDRAF